MTRKSPKISLNFSWKISTFFLVFMFAFLFGVSNTNSLKAQGNFVDLNFVVTDQSNHPISGATVNIDQDFGNGTSRTTDGGGFVNFGVIEDTNINYNISANNCSGTSGSVNSGTGTTVNVGLDCGDSTGGTGGNPNGWRQNIQYTINDNGNPVVYYYNVQQSGNKVFNWNVNVNFNGPDTMHVRTIGAYDDTAGSAATVAHPFGVPASGKVDYRNPPESGSFSFSYDTRYRTCGRVQIDGSFIDDLTGSDSQLFYAIVVDYGVDCVAQPANQPPVLTLVGSNPVNVVQGTSYTDAGATAMDPEEGNITNRIVRTGAVNTAVVGTYTVTYNVSDSQGLAATPITRTVNVTPAPVNHPPVLTLIGSNPITVYQGATYTDAGATAFDQEDGNITNRIVVTGSVNTAVVGTYTLTYNVSDSQGLAATPVTRTVNVVRVPENHPPVITLLGSNPVNVYVGSTYVDAGATAFDQEDGVITHKIATTTNVNTSVVGSYFVTYNVSDSQGLAATPVTRTVNVVRVPENHPPVITLVGPNPATVILGNSYTDAGATAFDQEDGNITNRISSTTNLNINVVGSYTVTYNVSDSQGLAATPVTRTVNVVPNQSNQCVLPDSLGDTQVDAVNPAIAPENDLSVILSNNNYVLSEQKQYQTWHTVEASTTVQVYVVAGQTAAGDVFGYYFKGHPDTFVPVFRVNDRAVDPAYENVPVYWPGQTVTFTVPASGDIGFAVHSTFQGTRMWTSENSLNVGGEDHMVVYDVASTSTSNLGSYILAFEDLPFDVSDRDYNDLVVKIDIASCTTPPVNHPPVLTLVGENPININLNDNYIDPGATAFDQEDGNITNKIVVTGSVDTSVVGTYTLTYNVSDSQGLAATPVSRTVNVLNNNPKGKITFCTILADNQNVIATTSTGLPTGTISLNLATSTAFGSTTIESQTWNTSTFSPNRKIILNQNDAHCVSYSNIEYGNYYYSQAVVSGTRWNIPKYNDGYNQTVNNVFDFFSYSPELFNSDPADDASRNFNSDGMVSVDSAHNDVLVVLYDTYNPAPQCVVPQITSSLTASVTVNNPFTYVLTASSTSDVLNVATTTLPAGLSYATTTHSITGTPTETGTYNITLTAQNECATDTQVLVLTVLPVVTSPSANLSVSKSVDKSTANVGDTITYTITVANNGPSLATNVSVSESFPTQLNFVSATPVLGTYSTTTNVWTIGNLENGSSTTLTLVGTIKSGTEGQKITNTATASASQNDPDNTNNTGTAETVVNTPGCTSNCGGGGGGGGSIAESNLGVTKTVDKTSANAGDTMTYTITVTNYGTYDATGVKVTESFPALLSFVSATTTQGTYDQSTSVWTVGDLIRNATATLTLSGKVLDQAKGQRVTNTVVTSGNQQDPDSSNNTSTANTDVTGGGGGGGNGPIVPNTPTVEGASTCYYLRDYLKKGWNNDPVEVTKLQVFLRDLEGFNNIQVTGVYDDQTIAYLNQFQWRYKEDILFPWGHTAPTSFTYILTKKKVNEIYCKMAFPVTPAQQLEIDTFRNFLLSLRNQGITPVSGGFTSPGTTNGGSTGGSYYNGGNDNSGEVEVPDVGVNTGSEATSTRGTSSDMTTLAGVSSTTKGIASRLTANVFNAGKRIGGWLTLGCTWLNLLLLLAIIIVSYFWYKEYKANKDLENINKEIDLK